MNDIFPTLLQWHDEGRAAALATVVKVYGSAPRPLGSKLAVSEGAAMVGSVSGGCVESAVVQEALAVIASGRPRLIEFGISEAWAQGAGLACGGNIEVFVAAVDEPGALRTLVESLAKEEVVAQATVLAGPLAGRRRLFWTDREDGETLGAGELDRAVQARAGKLLAAQQSERHTFTLAGVVHDVFIEVFAPPPHLIIVGAVHIAIPLITFARTLGFRTTVIDARGIFATPERFAHADRLMLRWPDEALADLALHESTYIAVLSHDDKLDVPALRMAAGSRARYIGALGSRRTMARRAEQLRRAGVSEAQLARIHNPIGLDLGGRTPEEIALAIMAEIVEVRRQGDK